MLKLTIDEKKAVLHYAMIRQDSTSVELAVIVALSGAGGEPYSHYGTTKQREMYMTWEYALIGLVVGIIIGAVAMRFGNRKLRQQQALQFELEKNKTELEEYREELVSHFARSAELLDNMADDYRQLYQHGEKLQQSAAGCDGGSQSVPQPSGRIRPVTIRRRSRCRATILKAHPACCAVAQNATDLSLPKNITRAHSLRPPQPHIPAII
jgi:alkylation response protein AidB-like acyl-CoA dehydrogenase